MVSEELIQELVNFFSVAVVFLIGIALVFAVFCKRFRFHDKNVELYGWLLKLNTQSLISISAITIHYLFLVWCIISFRGINIIYIAITLLLVLISEAVIDNFKGLPVSILLSVVNCIAIQLIYVLYQYLTVENFSYLLLIVLFLFILFVFLYYTYHLFRGINNVVVKHKYLKK